MQDTNAKIQQDVIHLVGGRDELGNNLKTIDEFNIKDMCIFEADWKLQVDLSGFSSVQGGESTYIAGGQSKDSLTGQLQASDKVFEVCFKKQKLSSKDTQ